VRSYRLLPVAFLALSSGCSGDPSFPDLHPLTGTVTREGKPVPEGGIIFVPEPGTGSGLIVNATVRPDGSFTAETSLTSRAGKTTIRPGAPAGRYKAVYHPPSDGSKTGLEVELDTPVVVAAGSPPVAFTLPAAMPAGHGAERDDERLTWPPGVEKKD
jgi:hypothetical protein